jgi:hypothetical protein
MHQRQSLHRDDLHKRLPAKSRYGLGVSIPIGAPRAELHRAGKRAEPRRAPHMRRGPCGERPAVDEDELEELAARRLQRVGDVGIV